jgi:PPOX class probable F420-dependent enzyme
VVGSYPMDETFATRPHMPGYGVLGPDEGSGLLPWSWAVQRLTGSHDYWVATVWPDGRPHVMPVWGVWLDGSVWFSSSLGSRKARNLARDPRAVATTDQPREPVVVDGVTRRVEHPDDVRAFAGAVNAKYGTDYGLDFYDPAVNACFRLRPSWVFALTEEDFAGSPTRWRF